MNVIMLLIFVSLPVATGFLISLLWNLKSGQYEDTYSPAARILFDDSNVGINHKTLPTTDISNSKELSKKMQNKST